MAAPLSISETQFVFAYFHKFALLQPKDWCEFIFPSLQAEGNPQSKYAGADLVVSKNIFIQFKVPYLLKTAGAKEFYQFNATDLFEPPFFRVKIKNELLAGKPRSGQYEMLQKIARSGKSAQYIFPVFNTEVESDNSGDKEYWFKNFFSKPPQIALNNYCLSVDFADMLSPNFILANVNTHLLSTDFERAMIKGEVYLFSEAKYIRASKFNSAVYLDEVLTWAKEEEKTIEATINETISLLELDIASNLKLTTISELQFAILNQYNIYWVPVLTKRSYPEN